MMDVALALEYLHNGRSESVVHCDLKPSNILLDEDLVAHVGDFGIAKILAENDTTQTQTIGTIGYIAPGIHEFTFVNLISSLISWITLIIANFKNNKVHGSYHQLSNVIAFDSDEFTVKLFVLCVMLTCQIQVN